MFGIRDNSLLFRINFRRRKLIQASVSSNKSLKFWFSKALAYFSMRHGNAYFFAIILFIQVVLYALLALINRWTWYWIQIFREVFPMERNSAHYSRNEILWKAVFMSKVRNILRKMVHVVIECTFSLFLKLILRFFLSLTVPFFFINLILKVLNSVL